MPLYFSYGSNMDPAKLRALCPSAVLLGPASLPGYGLAFTLFSQTRQCGCPDIVPVAEAHLWGVAAHALPPPSVPGAAAAVPAPGVVPSSAEDAHDAQTIITPVWGALYELSSADLPALDLAEGTHRQKYRRITLTILDATNSPRPAETYTVVHKSPAHVAPSRDFLGKILAAAIALNLPVVYVAFLHSTPTCD